MRCIADRARSAAATAIGTRPAFREQLRGLIAAPRPRRANALLFNSLATMVFWLCSQVRRKAGNKYDPAVVIPAILKHAAETDSVAIVILTRSRETEDARSLTEFILNLVEGVRDDKSQPFIDC